MTRSTNASLVALAESPAVVRSWTPPQGLEFDATPQQILGVLTEMGFSTTQLRSKEVFDCSDATLRNWAEGKSVPRGRNSMVIDDLRGIVVALHAAGIHGDRAQQWLFRRNFGRMVGGARPIELLTVTPLRLFSAVQDLMVRDPDGPSEDFHLRVEPEPSDAVVNAASSDTAQPTPGRPERRRRRVKPTPRSMSADPSEFALPELV